MGDALLDLGARQLRQLERECEILPHIHMRVERIGLEHHGHAALARRHVVDEPAVQAQFAMRDVLETGDHAQGRRFAAARGSDKDRERLVRDLQVDAAHGDLPAVHLDHVLEAYRGHDERCHRANPSGNPRSRFRTYETGVFRPRVRQDAGRVLVRTRSWAARGTGDLGTPARDRRAGRGGTRRRGCRSGRSRLARRLCGPWAGWRRARGAGRRGRGTGVTAPRSGGVSRIRPTVLSLALCP